jgi:sulfate/thiosulfate-binding protein
MKNSVKWILLVALFLVAVGAAEAAKTDEVTVIFAAYTVPKEVYQKEIIPAFQKYWKEKTGQAVKFEESYEASGAQSRAIAAGLEADIAALSLEKDINRLKDEGLITHDWKNNKYKGFVTNSLAVIAFRPGNPKKITDWEDLTKKDVNVIYPSPKTSGGAMWAINAIYGAGLKMSEIKTGEKDYAYARQLLKSIQKRVKVMDKSGRLAVTTFENGIGDVLVTYEDEALLRQKQGKEFPFLTPEATILIENPTAIIDINVDRHQTRKVATAFIEFVHSKEAQHLFAQYGLRPVNEEVARACAAKYPVPKYLFTINYLGGWNQVEDEIYGKNGVWTKIIEEVER